jgi:hypothetical protein
VLPKYWIQNAIAMAPELQVRIEFSEDFKNLDAAIATGSNNSARYFEYYFRNIPHLLRKNRNSAAVLSGAETQEQLIGLGHDVFDYFGLGCRNVTHILLPENYEFRNLFETWEPVFRHLINHNKYANNYNYHKALLLMNLDPHMDTGYLLLKEKEDLYSPVGMLNYSFYASMANANAWLEKNREQIQCVSSEIESIGKIKLGNTQNTMLWDYADDIDTLKWLFEI